MRFAVLIVAVVLAAVPAAASEPGQPLDCSDWVLTELGIWCEVAMPIPCNSSLCGEGVPRVVDNAGWVYRAARRQVSAIGEGCHQPLYRTEIVRRRGSTESVVAYIDERCSSPGANTADGIRPTKNVVFTQDYVGDAVILFEPTTGRLLLPLRTWCVEGGNGGCPGNYGGGFWVMGLRGLPSMFEILQTYTPDAGPISFRVPYMPEGFPAADSFDTYYGDLATVGDWSQAQPLQCGYPATAPCVGDYLTVADPLPTPTPGHGRYYVTAVTHDGQRRYGRKSSGGVLSGREPAVLPACSQSR